eukprot:8577181-Ditylum_brightwellii.AAC.1
MQISTICQKSLCAKTDEHCCLRCTSKCAAKPSKSKKQCSSYGGYGHERKSSKLCPHYGKKGPQKQPLSDTAIMGGGKKKKSSNAAQLENDGKHIEKSEAENKSISRPNFTYVKYKKEPICKPVIVISSPSFSPGDTEFHIIKSNDQTGGKETLEPTPEVLLDHWYPIWPVRSFLKSSNHYRSERKEKYPNHYSWKRERDSTEF